MNFNKIFKPNLSFSDAREIAIYFWSKKRNCKSNNPRYAMFEQLSKDCAVLEHEEMCAGESKLFSIFSENITTIRRYVVPSILDEGGCLFDSRFPIDDIGMHDLLSVSCKLNGQNEKVYFLDIEEDVEELLKFFDVLPDNVKQIVIDFKNGEQVPASYDEEDYYKEFPRKFAKINFNLKKSPKTLAQLQKRGLISEKTIPCAYKEKYPEVWKEIHAPFERDLEKIIKKQGLR